MNDGFGKVEPPIKAKRQSVHGYELDEDSKSTPSGVLGHGSYGVVYRATEIQTGAKVALKIVSHENRADIQQETDIYKVINNMLPLPKLLRIGARCEPSSSDMCNRLAWPPSRGCWIRMVLPLIPFLAMSWQGSPV